MPRPSQCSRCGALYRGERCPACKPNGNVERNEKVGKDVYNLMRDQIHRDKGWIWPARKKHEPRND